MGNKETNYKKILFGFSLLVGMILIATIIAVMVFFMSIPAKHSSDGPDAVEIFPGSNPVATSEHEFQKFSDSQPRDPFLPPAIAWPNLKTVSPGLENGKEHPVKISDSLARAIPKKTKATPVKNPATGLRQGQGNSPVIPTANPEPDPNIPEFKEILILPGMNQDIIKETGEENDNNGLKKKL
jgi:hypothetical protein